MAKLPVEKVFATIVSILLCTAAHSQAVISFCTYINAPAQECVFDNTKFITSPDSTRARIFIMLKSAQVFTTKQLTYKAYAIDRFGKEVFLFDISQAVEPTWMNGWQPATFTTPGKYIVKVYRDADHMIASKGFEFFNN